MGSKILNNQRGIALPIIIGAMIIIAVIGGGAFYVLSNNKDDTGDVVASVSTKALETECKKQFDDKDFCKFASNVNFKDSYRSTITSSESEDNTTITLEADSNGNTRTVTTVNGQEVAAFISIGNTSYSKDIIDGQWTKFTSEPTEKNNNPSDNLDFDFDEDKTTPDNTQYKKLEKEACGSLTCFKYQIVDPDAPTDESIVWFDDNDYKLRRYTFKNVGGTTDISYRYESITINEPSPIKKASNGIDAATQAEIDAALREFENAQ